MLSWAHGPVTSRLWDLGYLNGAIIKRRSFILEEILCRVTFLRGNSSIILLIQEAGAVRVGEFQAPSVFALLHAKLRWKQREKKKGGRLVNLVFLHFRAAPEKPRNHPPCGFQSPHQGLWSLRSISSPSSLHSKEHCPHFMAGSTCQPDLGEWGCWTLSAKAQGVDNRTGEGYTSFSTSGASS